MITTGLTEAARFERDHRAESYARRINAGDTLDIETATVDYQCWVAIAEFVETGRFQAFYGGADQSAANPPWIGLAALESAAEAALTTINSRIERLEGAPNVQPETLGALRDRRSWLSIIFGRVKRQRQIVDEDCTRIPSTIQEQAA